MICSKCGKLHKNKKFCSLSCANSFNNSLRIVKEETKKKISNSKKGKGHLHSEETKLIISQKRKEYLKTHNNNWSNMKISKPCEYLKNILKQMNIFFIEELIVVNYRYFRIDVALPEYKIGIEVNGNQHYKKIDDLVLDDYYEERHRLIEKEGWKLIELYYKTVYDKNIIDIILNILKNKKYEYDIENKKYIISCLNKKIFCKKCKNEIIYGNKCEHCENVKKDLLKNKKLIELKNKLRKLKKLKFKLNKKEKKYNLCECGNMKLYFSPTCKFCSHLKQRKVERPPYDQLINQIEELGYCGVGEKYNVTDVAVRKWKINYEKTFL